MNLQQTAINIQETTKKGYLCNIFVDLTTNLTTYGLFNKDDEQIYTFNEQAEELGASKAVDPKNIPILVLPENLVHPNDITLIASEEKKEHAKGAPILKEFLLLQQFQGKLVWQYVGLTQSLESISLRYDAATKELVETSVEKLIDMQQGTKS